MIDRKSNYGRHHIRKFLEECMPFQSVLDVGAGGGDDLMIARDINNLVKLNALESYKPSIEKLMEKGISVHSTNIERELFPFKDGACDVIVANQVLEHTKEIFWIFHEITRVLPVGGKLILGVPNLASLHNRLLLLLGRQPSPIKTASAHVRGFTKKDLLDFLESCFPGGYQFKGFGGSNFYPFPPFAAKPLAKILPSMAWGIFFLFEKQLSYYQEFIEFPEKQKLETNFYRGS
ncbi:MAG: methionine biosynthesis protein MetW [Desulfobacterium sp.]